MVGGPDAGDVLGHDGHVDAPGRRLLLCHGGLGAASSPVETQIHLLVRDHPGPGGPPEQLLGGRTMSACPVSAVTS